MFRKAKGQAPAGWSAILGGILGAWVLLVAGVVLTGKLLDTGSMEMDSVGYVVMGILFLCGAVSGWIPAIRFPGKKYLGAVTGTAGFFLLLLLINGLFFGGAYPGFWSGLVSTALGNVLALFLAGKGSGKKSRVRYKIPK